MRARTLALRIAVVALSACGARDEEEPTPEPTTAPRYAEIDAAIFTSSCTFACHSGGELAAGGFDMRGPPDEMLVGVPASAPACAGTGWKRVVAGRADESLLYLKIAAKLDESPVPCGESMPAGANRDALAADQIDLVRAWIEAGAATD